MQGMIANKKVVIVGGGIAGLSAALATVRCGAQVRVLERASQIAEVGAGLQITPNGAQVLAGLGLLKRVDSVSTRLDAVELLDGRSGAPVLRLALDDAKYRQPYRVMHRGDLIAVLADAAGAAGVHMDLSTEIVNARGGALPHAVLESGETVGGDVVIGADGLRSRVRAELKGINNPTYSGLVAWRATVPLPENTPKAARVWMLPGRHVTTYPLTHRGILNIVAVESSDQPVDEGWYHPGDPIVLQTIFKDAAPELARILREVTSVHRWGLYQHRVPTHWSEGALGMIGDAAHPMLPFLAQGANMALEDAWLLAAHLDAARDPARGLNKFTAARLARIRRVVGVSAQNARAYHLSGPVRVLGHAVLRATGRLAPGAARARFDWLYGYDPTRGI